MPNNFDIEKVIRAYLPGIIHMSMATCVDNKPWVCEVHYVYDDQLNLYFRSKPSRRHCKELAINPNVAGNIVTQHTMSEKPRGIYFEGRAELLKNVSKNDEAYKKCRERFGKGPEILTETNQPDGGQFFKISVSDYYVFDARESVPAQKYHLKWHNN